MSLKEIFCQDKALEFLQRYTAADRTSQSFIFAGHDGVGKLTTARQWAKSLLCYNPVSGKTSKTAFVDSCDNCNSCRLFAAGTHPDFNLIYKELREFTREGKGKTVPVDLPIDVIREFVNEKINTKPSLSAKKVFVICEAEKLNDSSQNALLKTLEEPPDFCTIILVCTQLENLLPTIKSRSQIIRFGQITEDKITEKLQQLSLDSQKSRYFARLAQGSIGNACAWANLETQNADLFRTKQELLESLAPCTLPDSIDFAEWLLDKSKKLAAVWIEIEPNSSKTDINRRAQKIIIQMFIAALTDAMRIHVTQDKDHLINADQYQLIAKIAQRFPPDWLSRKIIDSSAIMQRIDASVNEKLIFEQLLLNLFDCATIVV